MKLIFKNKLFWKQKLYNQITGEEYESWMVHPLFAIPTIILAPILTFLLLDYLLLG